MAPFQAVRLEDGEKIEVDGVILAAGAWSAKLATQAWQ